MGARTLQSGASMQRNGYHHRSILRRDAIKPELSAEQRQEVAYERSQDLLDTAFGHRAKLDGSELRIAAARGFIIGGISDKPGEDIAAVTRRHRQDGVRLGGEPTAIEWTQEAPVRGRHRWAVTTVRQAELETEVIAIARTAAADKSAALPVEQVDRAAGEFLMRNPKIDPTGEQWRAQREMMIGLATRDASRSGLAPLAPASRPA